MQPNMKKEYKRELKLLGKQLGAMNRKIDRVYRSYQRKNAVLERIFRRQQAALKTAEQKEVKTLGRLAARALVRRSILEGRLS